MKYVFTILSFLVLNSFLFSQIEIPGFNMEAKKYRIESEKMNTCNWTFYDTSGFVVKRIDTCLNSSISYEYFPSKVRPNSIIETKKELSDSALVINIDTTLIEWDEKDRISGIRNSKDDFCEKYSYSKTVDSSFYYSGNKQEHTSILIKDSLSGQVKSLEVRYNDVSSYSTYLYAENKLKEVNAKGDNK